MASPLNLRPGGSRWRYRWALGTWLAVATVPAAAQLTPVTGQSLFQYRAGSGYSGNYLAADGGFIYTDNVLRTASGSGETLLLVGLSGTTSREGTRLDYHLSSNLAAVKYLGGAYPTEPTGYLDGTVVLKFVPGFFSWIVRETYSQVQIDPYAPVTPDNLESLNYITTGPRFTMRPTLRTSVTLDALYSYLNSSSPSPQYLNLDNHRYGGDLRIDRAFSETASLYLKGHYEKVDFKDQVNNNNFSIGEAVAGYKLTDGRTVFDLSGGYSQLRVYDVLAVVEGPGGSRESLQTEEFDEPIWRVDLSRLITPSQRIALHASQLFTDAAGAFRLGFDQPVPTTAPTQLATGDPFKQRDFGVDWRIQGPRTTFNVGLSYLRQRYLLDSSADSDVKMAHALLDRQLSPVLNWSVGVTYDRNEQVGTPPASGGVAIATGQSSKVLTALTDVRWQVGARLALRFFYGYSRQSGTYSYSDNQVGVTASWALIGAMQASPELAPVAPASTRSP